ncbi:MAG TPA: 4Fe-4S dicluster domain-containing protein [Nitrospinota bacterium]|jgi:carbon-monoxide dehydrogenase iron sulfur subunit|nr:4Fe-4S dicluster domain-containing protein [Nitrospinota bacterium]|tara:strand:+ start:66148 stop:66654 length:507 start_codon:yes stop_codon:yes gene_type:complete
MAEWNKLRRIIATPTGECDGCQKCVDACSQVKTQLSRDKGESLTGLDTPATIKISKLGDLNVPVICRNCSEAPCVTACMTGCITQDEEGMVSTDTNRCVGCWMCIMNCPFGAIERVESSHVAVMCDGCKDCDVAPCVKACKPGVIIQTDIVEFTDGIRKSAATQFLQG